MQEMRKQYPRTCKCGNHMQVRESKQGELPHTAFCPVCKEWYDCNAYYPQRRRKS